MGPHRELELEQKLVRGKTVGVTGAPELAANLAKLTRPVSHNQSPACVDQMRAVESAGPVKSSAQEPAPRELVIGRNVESLGGRIDVHGLLGTVPDVLETTHKRVVNRAAQGLPSHGGVHSIELVNQRLGNWRMAA